MDTRNNPNQFVFIGKATAVGTASLRVTRRELSGRRVALLGFASVSADGSPSFREVGLDLKYSLARCFMFASPK
jgi:hypothetical protein